MSGQQSAKEPADTIYLSSATNTALRQGEILSDLSITALTLDSVRFGGTAAVNKQHPYSLVLTQSCDLEQDWRRRVEGNLQHAAIIPCVLCCEAYAEIPSPDTRKRIKENREERYHSLETVSAASDLQATGVPELTVDFKRYFTIPTDELYLRLELGSARRRCYLLSPYREHLSTRFSAFLARVALPRQHHSQPPDP